MDTPNPLNLYSVFITKSGSWTVATVYKMGDQTMTPVLPQIGYQSEASAIRAIKRRLRIPAGKKNLLIHREPWIGRIETIGWR